MVGTLEQTMIEASIFVGAGLSVVLLVVLAVRKLNMLTKQHRGTPIPLSPTNTADDFGPPSSVDEIDDLPSATHIDPEAPLPQPADESQQATGSKTRKMHVFVILGDDYHQKQCKLSARNVIQLSDLHEAVQDLFAEVSDQRARTLRALAHSARMS
jgi:hypothetical protein